MAEKLHFADQSGYLLHPDKEGKETPVALGHTASVAPWQDADVHLHEVATEIFILLQGQLRFLVAEQVLVLRPWELLLVRPGVPHAIVGGSGPIEHFGLRAPAVADRKTVKERLLRLPGVSQEEPRALRRAWGCRRPLAGRHTQTVAKGWYLGPWNSHSPIPIGFATAAIDEPHYHAEMTEIYMIIAGESQAVVEGERLALRAGDLLVVEPGEGHTFVESSAGYFHLVIHAPFVKGDKHLQDTRTPKGVGANRASRGGKQ